MTNSFIYPSLLAEMRDADAIFRVRDELRLQPMTVVALSKALQIRQPIIRLAITQLRYAGHVIENRGARSGKPAIKGTYHLVGLPGATGTGREVGTMYQSGNLTWRGSDKRKKFTQRVGVDGSTPL
jgi:hypothetical protein